MKLRNKISELENEVVVNNTLLEEATISNREKDAQVRETNLQLEKAKASLKELRAQFKSTETEAMDSISQKIRELQVCNHC